MESFKLSLDFGSRAYGVPRPKPSSMTRRARLTVPYKRNYFDSCFLGILKWLVTLPPLVQEGVRAVRKPPLQDHAIKTFRAGLQL